MFGFGRRGKVKKAADKFVEAMVMESENSFRSFLQIIMQQLTDDDVDPERVAEISNAASPSLVFFAALFSYEMVKSKYAFDGEIGQDIGMESFKALQRNTSGPTGDAMRASVNAIIENLNIQNQMMPIGEKRELELIGWNALKFFDFDANPEIRKLMDNTACTAELSKFLEETSKSWWKSAEKIGLF
jgi:hypothetical protein